MNRSDLSAKSFKLLHLATSSRKQYVTPREVCGRQYPTSQRKWEAVWVCWCVDVLMCWCVDVLMCWCIGVLMCWCVDVLMCWCVDVLVCWCVVDVLMCWCGDVLMCCWCVDVLMCWECVSAREICRDHRIHILFRSWHLNRLMWVKLKSRVTIKKGVHWFSECQI